MPSDALVRGRRGAMDDIMRPTSARGPRRGFFWQDWYAARTLLRCWHESAAGIRRVEVEAEDTAHIDDVVVHRDGRSSYYQLKRIEKGQFTSSLLLGPSKSGLLLRKLFVGWKRMRSRSGGLIEVILATNATLSRSPKNIPCSPAFLCERILRPLHLDVSWRPEAELTEIWKLLEHVTEAESADELAEFLSAFSIEAGMPSEAELRRDSIRLLSHALRSEAEAELEVDAWMARVYELATRPDSPPSLDRHTIGLEIRRLFQISRERLEHRLSLPDNHLPRRAIAEDILGQAEEIATGYLFISGPPGSGKTTLATWMADNYPDKILLRYHIFHPQRTAGIERQRRSTALAFVSEFLAALAERLPESVSHYLPSEATVDRAVEVLWAELEKAAAVGPGFVIIDGLDHVVRSNVAEAHGLLNALRRRAPPGVVFLLFGQPGWPYPRWIEAAPRVDLRPFSWDELSMLLSSSLKWVSADPALAPLTDKFHGQTKGNPLSLFYLLAELERFESASEAAANLASVRVFGERPHDEYGLLLEEVEALVPSSSRSFRRELLAWLAVATVPVTAERLASGFSEDDLSLRQARDVLEALRPVVIQREGRFQIFHDDFRRYAEGRIAEEERVQAHARHSASMEHAYHPSELQALAEHLWSGKQYEKLAELPSIRDLEDWLTDYPVVQVESLYRLACAASISCGSDADIISSCLACKLAHDASPSWYRDNASFDSPKDIKGWTFIVPPSQPGHESLRVRAEALAAAARWFEDDPESAETIATRFTLGEFEPPTEDGRLDHGYDSYLAAWAHWLLASGRAAVLADWIRSIDVEVPQVEIRLSSLLSTEARPSVLEAWIAELLPAISRIETSILDAAVEQVVSGRLDCGAAIVRLVLPVVNEVSDWTRRDVLALGCLLGICELTDDCTEAPLRWSAHSDSGDRFRDFFFSGMARGYASRGQELSSFEFPERLREAVEEHGTDAYPAEACWRCGLVAGLARRSAGLVRATELQRVVEPFAAEVPGAHRLDGFELSGGARLYLPLTALAVREAQELSEAMRGTLLAQAETELRTPGSRTTGIVEALWVLDPGTWQAAAASVLQGGPLPRSDYSARRDWFDYWIHSATTRGVEIPRRFLHLASISLLGVYRKTYPGSLAVSLLSVTRHEPGFGERLRDAVDVLLKVSREPEGGRSAYRQLPEVLGIALDLDGRLFFDEFMRAVECDAIDPFGSGVASIAEGLLSEDALQRFRQEEMVGLWHWIAACPGSDDSARGIAERIIAALTDRGELDRAKDIEAWVECIAPPRRDLSSEIPDQISVSQPEERPEGTAEFDFRDITPKWFSSWWSPQEYKHLQDTVQIGGDESWLHIRESLAVNLAASPDAAAHVELIAEAVPSLRPSVDRRSAFRAALGYLSKRVSFQEEPPARSSRSESHSMSRSQAFVRLLVEGLGAPGAEVVHRSVRAVVAMSEMEELRNLSEPLLREKLHSPIDRQVALAVAALRVFPRLSPDTHVAIEAVISHRNAWCRWLAGVTLERIIEWPDPLDLGAAPGPVALAATPSKQAVGSLYYSDASSIRHIYVRRLAELTGLEEGLLRELIELEYREVSHTITEGRGTMRPHQVGPALTTNRMGDAAARAISKLVRRVSAVRVPALISTAASFDPWLAITHPSVPPPEGWVELGLSRESSDSGIRYHLLRAIGLIDSSFLATLDAVEDVASHAMRFVVPTAPAHFPWVSECWANPLPPTIARGPIVPFVFLNSPFTELTRDRFQLVPRWELPIFNGLDFHGTPRPAWLHHQRGAVVVASYQEWKERSSGVAAGPSWFAGWYASREWLRKSLAATEGLELIQFSREASGRATDDSTDEKQEVLFSARRISLQ